MRFSRHKKNGSLTSCCVSVSTALNPQSSLCFVRHSKHPSKYRLKTSPADSRVTLFFNTHNKNDFSFFPPDPFSFCSFLDDYQGPNRWLKKTARNIKPGYEVQMMVSHTCFISPPEYCLLPCAHYVGGCDDDMRGVSSPSDHPDLHLYLTQRKPNPSKILLIYPCLPNFVFETYSSNNQIPSSVFLTKAGKAFLTLENVTDPSSHTVNGTPRHPGTVVCSCLLSWHKGPNRPLTMFLSTVLCCDLS